MTTTTLQWPEPGDWTEKASCSGLLPEEADRLFFPDILTPNAIDDAKAFCSLCPVRTECGDFARAAERGLPDTERYGMFGGLTPQERADADQE